MTYKNKTAKTISEAQKSTPSKNKKKSVTLNEFRAWLSGVEEMQPDDWHPDLGQWRIIREKIDCVIGNSSTIREQHNEDNNAEQQNERQVRPVRFERSALMDAIPNNPAPAFAVDAKGAIKTPVIDTSNGNYASSLE